MRRRPRSARTPRGRRGAGEAVTLVTLVALVALAVALLTAGAPASWASVSNAASARRTALPVALRHELEEAAATLTMRPDGLVELRLHVPWTAVLLRHVGGARAGDTAAYETHEAQRLRLVNLAPAAFARVYADARSTLARGIVWSDGARRRAFDAWRWPDAAAVQQALRDDLMASVVDGASHTHIERLPATAALRASPSGGDGRVGFPALLGPVLLTVVHPQEQWIRAGGTSGSIARRR